MSKYPRLGRKGNHLARFAALLSQAANLLFLNGSPSETISGRCYRQGVIQNSPSWLKAKKAIDAVFFWQEGHCLTSHTQDKLAAESLRDIYQKYRGKA